jgi:hypothetical protein
MILLRRLAGALPPTVLTSLLAFLLLAAIPAAVHAQEASTPTTGTSTTEGLQEAISRQYGADPDAPVASPTADLAAAPFTVTARVLTYDSADHATAAYDASIAGAIEQVQGMGVDMTSQVEEADLPDLGDTAHGLTLHSTRDGLSGYIRFVFVRQESTVFILTAIAGSDDGARITDRIAAAMLEREPGDDTAQFREDGTSTGGLWELLPPEGDTALEGLVIIQDQQLVSSKG